MKSSFQILTLLLLGTLVGLLGVFVYNSLTQDTLSVGPEPEKITPTPKEKPLQKYAILELANKTFGQGAIILDEVVGTTSAYTAQKFHFNVEGKKVTGLAHFPARTLETQSKTSQKKYPVIVQFRGYVDREIYTSGIGTQRSAQVFAQNGFISLAPDFLGYGGSDMPSANIFEERFQTYLVALTLLASVDSLPMADFSRIGLWGHSNGGHIALTVLEVLNKPVPTTLWAPVTKPFPYSILFFTDELEDKGKFLRRELAAFEKEYDVDEFTVTSYIDRLAGPIQLHQGTEDEAVPKTWSDEFKAFLQKHHVDVTYFVYPGADHNLTPGWDTVVARDVAFFKKHL